MKSQNGAIAQKNPSIAVEVQILADDVKRRKRYSLAFKQECVRQIDAKEMTIAGLAREYDVSDASLYKWLESYSPKYQKSVVVVTELTSESGRSKRLEAENKDLLALIGKQQVEIRYWQTLIETAEAHYSIDIKKNCVP
jgi:transposase-like protein